MDIYRTSVPAIKRCRKIIFCPPTAVRIHPLQFLAGQKLSSLVNPTYRATEPTHTYIHTLTEQREPSLACPMNLNNVTINHNYMIQHRSHKLYPLPSPPPNSALYNHPSLNCLTVQSHNSRGASITK